MCSLILIGAAFGGCVLGIAAMVAGVWVHWLITIRRPSG
jgi:hypothetical protein